jgi:excisionase family DNA binding protein
MTDTLLSISEAARLLEVSTDTLRRWADRGLIETVRLPSGHRRYPRSAVEAIRTDKASA